MIILLTELRPIRISAEPITAPAAQQIVDHHRQSATFYPSEIATSSQALTQTNSRLQAFEKHGAVNFVENY